MAARRRPRGTYPTLNPETEAVIAAAKADVAAAAAPDTLEKRKGETWDAFGGRLLNAFAEERRERESKMTPEELAAEEAKRQAVLTRVAADDDDYVGGGVSSWFTKDGWRRSGPRWTPQKRP